MFASPVTRPLRWAIPLAVLGAVVAAGWYLRPLEVELDGVLVNCRDVVFASDFGGDLCGDVRRKRLLTSGLIALVAGLPLIVVTLRAAVWAADALYTLRGELRRLHDRLDRLDPPGPADPSGPSGPSDPSGPAGRPGDEAGR